MTDTLERELRRSLADHAPDVTDHADPWDRVQRGVVVRRRRRTGAVAGSLALAVALGGGLAVVKPWAGGEPTQPATVETTGWGLDDGRPRGALAGDEDLRAGVEQVLVGSLLASDGTAAEVVPGSARLLFADDVDGLRFVLAVAQTGEGEVSATFAGPAGAAAEDLARGSEPTVPAADTAPAAVQVVRTDDGPRLLAVVPRGARVSVSDAVAVDAAERRIVRSWRAVEVSGDGLVDTALTSEKGSGLAVLRIDSAPGYAPEAPVAELAREWPLLDAEELRWAEASEVIGRGPQTFRDGQVPRPVDEELLMPVPDAVDGLVLGVAAAMGEVGSQSADDVRLLYASGDGADTARGAGGWSSLVEVQVAGGSVVEWDQHLADGGSVRSSTAATVSDVSGERILLRAYLNQQTDLVGIWDPEGTLGTVQIDGEDAIMPEALGFRWFPVPAGTDVVVDGEAVPPVPQEATTSWPLLGEEHPGPDPLFTR